MKGSMREKGTGRGEEGMGKKGQEERTRRKDKKKGQEKGVGMTQSECEHLVCVCAVCVHPFCVVQLWFVCLKRGRSRYKAPS